MYKLFLNLGNQPFANNFKNYYKEKERKFKLTIGFEDQNYLVSISKNLNSKNIYNNKYPYLSSLSLTMQKSFYLLSKKIKKKFNPNKIIEIGSNDGSFVKNFKKKVIICIEPCGNLSKITKKLGYETYNNFWNAALINKLKKKNEKIDLIYSANTISHINNLHEVFGCVSKILDKSGILIVEDPSLLETIKKNIYDQFYNEHKYVFSLIAIEKIITQYNLEVFDIENLETHGGSIRFYIKHKQNNKFKITKKVFNQRKKEINYGLKNFITYKKFAKRIYKSRIKLIKIFYNLKKNNKKIIGYGATAKSATVLNFCNINYNHIDYFLDTTTFKINKFTPGTNIFVKKYRAKLTTQDANYIFLGAWNFKKEIFKKEKFFLNSGGKFITHVPNPQIISKNSKL
jgi:methylation protein EvaC